MTGSCSGLVLTAIPFRPVQLISNSSATVLHTQGGMEVHVTIQSGKATQDNGEPEMYAAVRLLV